MTALFIITLLTAAEFCAEAVYKRSAAYRASLGGADALRRVPDGIDICNVGSGPGLYAISYENCPRKGMNFSTAPQNFRYGFRILKRFQKKIRKNAIIVIVMCPLSFGNNLDYFRPDYSDKFYGILRPEEIDGYSFRRAVLLHFPLLRRAFGASRRRLFPAAAPETHSQEPPIITVWKREFCLKDLRNPAQAAEHQDAFNEKINLLREEVAFCHERQWRPVLVTPPVSENTRRFISPEFSRAFVFDNLDALRKNYPEVPLLNYYDDSRFDNSMFLNDVFLNREGQTRFSEILFADIDKWEEE